MTVGLARGTVRLEPYNPEWEKFYQYEAKLIREMLSNNTKDMQHVGSTSIPGLMAKPLIDIAIKVDDLNIAEEWAKPLATIGYWYKVKQADMPDRRFFAKGPESNRTVYLHVVNQDEYDRMIKFRDSLRRDPKLAKEYSNLKEELAKNLSEDRKKYTSSKDEFIQRVIG